LIRAAQTAVRGADDYEIFFPRPSFRIIYSANGDAGGALIVAGR
jgi:hypothetical protein